MEVISSKREAELGFWSEEARRADWKDQRKFDWDFYTSRLPVQDEKGRGLDLGCGAYSVFEFAPQTMEVYAVDPLWNRYAPLRGNGYKGIVYQQEDGEALSFPDASFDFVWCVNVIDHTPNPEKMIEEIKRVLKPNGKLYFEVHFDKHLYMPHYHLWRFETVEHYLDMHLEKGLLTYEPQWDKYCYWGVYVNAPKNDNVCKVSQ